MKRRDQGCDPTRAQGSSPAVLIHAPRQCGKTTLSQVVGRDLGYTYFTFDDDVVFDADFRGLRRLKAAAGGRFAGGVVLYDGETTASVGDRLYAVPLRALWEAR